MRLDESNLRHSVLMIKMLALCGSTLRERCIEKKVKKLTSVSFAFTHTYTLAKLALLLFSPKRTWKILNNESIVV